MAVISYPTMFGIVPTFGGINSVGAYTSSISFDTETGESWDADGNPVVIPEEAKKAPFAGIVSTIRQPYPGWHGSVIKG